MEMTSDYSGLPESTKEARRKASRKYYEAHKAKAAQDHAAWQQANRDKAAEYNRRTRERKKKNDDSGQA